MDTAELISKVAEAFDKPGDVELLDAFVDVLLEIVDNVGEELLRDCPTEVVLTFARDVNVVAVEADCSVELKAEEAAVVPGVCVDEELS